MLYFGQFTQLPDRLTPSLLVCLLYSLPAGSKSELSGGQLSSVSPSKALPLNIAIPPANSPNKFLASHTMETADFLQPQDAVDTTDFLSSLGAARRESESTDGEGETSFSRMISDMGSKTVMGEVDMSRTLAAMSDSMLPDDTLEEDGVNAMGFLAGLQDTSVSSGVSVRSAGGFRSWTSGEMENNILSFYCFLSRKQDYAGRRHGHDAGPHRPLHEPGGRGGQDNDGGRHGYDPGPHKCYGQD